MTTEMIVTLIGEGGNDELLPLAWERVRRYFHQCARQYFERSAERYMLRGLTLDDIKQESYFAFLEAVKAYGVRPPKHQDTPFLAFCRLQNKRHCLELLGVRTKTELNDPLTNYPIRLDEPVTDGDGNETPLGALIPDTSAEQAILDVEENEEKIAQKAAIRCEVHTMLQDAPDLEALIEEVYFQNKPITRAAEALGVEYNIAKESVAKARRRLSQSKILREIAQERGFCYHMHIGIDTFKRYGSIEEILLERRERYGLLKLNKQ